MSALSSLLGVLDNVRMEVGAADIRVWEGIHQGLFLLNLCTSLFSQSIIFLFSHALNLYESTDPTQSSSILVDCGTREIVDL